MKSNHRASRTAYVCLCFAASTMLAPAALAQSPTTPTAPTVANKAETPKTVVLPSTKFDIKLKGYVFGLRVMKANYKGMFNDRAYSVRADLHTSGIGAFMKKFQIWATTQGRIDKNGLNPRQHIQQNMDKKNRRVEMNYGTNKVDVSIVPRLGSLGKPPATEKQKFTSDDTLSALLFMMMRGHKFTGEPCSGKIPVFDSKQHYNLRLQKDGTKRIKQKGYKGDTIRCLVYYEAVSGYDPEDLPSAEEAGAPIKIYLAKYDDAGLYVPVRMSYKISVFNAVIKARDIKISKD